MGSASLGSAERPIRVAIVGAGPAGFFTADALLRRETPVFQVDLFDRLPTPYGLVRSGVAPDHQKIKAVTKVFDKTAKHPRFRFLGNVELGRDLSATELRKHYDQVVYSIGSSGDRSLGIPGEDTAGCYAATAFVGWYNGHPDFAELKFDLSSQRAIVVGVGNVAIDVARVLLRSPDELGKTDMPEYAVAALRASKVREVVLMARRGAAQVAFDTSELSDILALDGVGVSIDQSAVEPDLALMDELDSRCKKNVELMLSIAKEGPRTKERVLRIELLASPVEVLAGPNASMAKVKVERNQLVRSEDGSMRPKGTGKFFDVEAGALFRSVGYRGVPMPELPFDERAGTIPNADGRVITGKGGEVIPATYAVGWIRRGPTGVIGTNKADANSVVELMLEDVAKLGEGDPAHTQAAIDALLTQKKIKVVSYQDWQKLDALEVSRGKEHGKVREKLPSIAEMLSALG